MMRVADMRDAPPIADGRDYFSIRRRRCRSPIFRRSASYACYHQHDYLSRDAPSCSPPLASPGYHAVFFHFFFFFAIYACPPVFATFQRDDSSSLCCAVVTPPISLTRDVRPSAATLNPMTFSPFRQRRRDYRP